MPRPKVCPSCRVKFEPVRPLQVACSPLCAIQHVDAQKSKRERKETRERRAKVKTRLEHMKDAQAVFNRYIRLRDAGQPCISCGRHHQGQNHAGHYRSVGACPELRFNESNVHLQCSPCNNYLSGNIVLYRKGLIAKIGLEFVEWIEGKHEPKKYTVEDLKAIKAHYSALCKQFNDGNGGIRLADIRRPANTPSPYHGELEGEIA